MNDVLVILFVGLHVVWVVDGRGSPMIDSSAVSTEYYNSRRAAVQQQQRREYKRREYMAYCAVLWPVRLHITAVCSITICIPVDNNVKFYKGRTSENGPCLFMSK
jgi:hypothetical protein